MKAFELSTIAEFVDTALGIARGWSDSHSLGDVWYRGVKCQDYSLLPGAYFRNPCDELSLGLFFRSLAPALLIREPLDDWDWYYTTQHYGLPTRLLDWSESPLAALYFAVSESCPGKRPTVWALDPYALNALSGEPSAILCPYPGTDLQYWLPDYCGRHSKPYTFTSEQSPRFKDNSQPLAIMPKRSNPRIIAQRGVFTVHGSAEVPIDELPLLQEDGTSALAKILFPPDSHESLRRDLYFLGVKKSAIFPEPQSIADDLKAWLGVR